MPMLQFYYTSCSKGTSGGAGFQYKALSRGITSEDISILNSLIGYRISPALVERPISDHPAALRYEYINSGRCVLLCSRSNGSDENGRPGNFFAHGVITSPHDFDVMPPIMFWGSEFWKLRDDSSSLDLPVSESFDQPAALEFDDLWPFINRGSRRQTLSKLVSAVVSFGQAKRPIVILDSVENVALWILAVNVALPQVYRPLISFATYHHDPYQAPFLITGTTADSRFRFSADEYVSYFIVNTQQDRVSDIAETGYARFVRENFSSEKYDEVLMDFFQLCGELIPQGTLAEMTDSLEAVTAFYRAIRRSELPVTDTQVKKGIQYFLNYLQNCAAPCDADRSDLVTVVDRLGQEVMAEGNDIEIVNAYGASLRLIKQLDPNFIGHARGYLNSLLDMLWKNKEKAAASLLSAYQRIYTDGEIAQVVSNPEYLARVAKTPMERIDIQMVVWRYLGPFIHVDGNTRPRVIEIIRNALKACERLQVNNPDIDKNIPPPEALRLLDLILKTSIDLKVLFDAGLNGEGDDGKDAFLWLYYRIVAAKAIQDRKPFRKLAGPLENDFAIYEVIRDVQTGGLVSGATILLTWLHYLEANQFKPNEAIENGLYMLWSLAASSEEKRALAERILSQPRFSPYIDNWLPKYLNAYFNGQVFCEINQAQTEIYTRYANHMSLTSFQKGILGGSLAMTTGRFRDSSIPEIRKVLTKLSADEYKSEAGKLIAGFFRQNINAEAHSYMIRSAYIIHYDHFFWQIYWHYFGLLMLDSLRVREFVALLDFWFSNRVVEPTPDIPYVTAQFFLTFGEIIAIHNEKKEFDRAAYAIQTVAQDRDWYPIISEYFDIKRKKGILNFFQK